jgi:DNA primase
MGACDQRGDVFSLVMKAENVSFRRAAEILLEISGSIPAAETVQTRRGTEHPILVRPQDDLSDIELLTHVTAFYHRAFLNDPKVKPDFNMPGGGLERTALGNLDIPVKILKVD